MITEKMPKSFFQKYKKKFSNKKNHEKSGFAALCSEVVFCVFLKIKVVVLLKNGQRYVCPKVGK
jgi:hypothetical protein